MKGWALLAALFLGALALRPQLVGVGPLIPEIDEDLDVSHAVAGLLTTIPVLCMGLFAIPGAYVAARLGTRAAIGACLAGIAVFGLLRAAAPGAPLVLALTFPIGVGMGLAGALMPVAVKERFAHRPAFASGVYTTGINMGSALSSALAVPIAAAWGGWRAALGGVLGLHDPLPRGVAVLHAARARRASPDRSAAASLGPPGRLGPCDCVRPPIDRLLRARRVDA